jgi:FKBP-type peptidyl-prolyl cis-trans isomerase FkpA
MLKKLFAASLLFFVLAGCGKETKCEYDPCANPAPEAEVQRVQTYLTSAGISNAQKHCSGVFYVITEAGTGNNPNSCSNVSVSYVGKLEDGTVFDQTTPQNPTAVFNLRSLISAWTNVIPQLKKGGKVTLFVPPSKGYGSEDVIDRSTGRIIIPGNSILIFDITLNDLD